MGGRVRVTPDSRTEIAGSGTGTPQRAGPAQRRALRAFLLSMVAVVCLGLGMGCGGDDQDASVDAGATGNQGSTDAAGAEGVALEFVSAWGSFDYQRACELSVRLHREGPDCVGLWGRVHERAGEPTFDLADVVDSAVAGNEATVQIESARDAAVVSLELEDDAWVVHSID